MHTTSHPPAVHPRTDPAAPPRPRRGPTRGLAATAGILAATVAALVIARTVDTDALVSGWNVMVAQPRGVAVALGAFGLAFAVRAAVWRRVLPDLSFGQSLAAINLALGANHVLPLRLGEPLRVLSVVRRTDIPIDSATSSTITLRAADIVAVLALGWLVAPAAFWHVMGPWVFAVAVAVGLLGVLGLRWMISVRRRMADAVRLPGPAVAAGTVGAWLLEAVVIWQCAHWAGIEVSATGAVLVTTLAVSAQIAAVAPGGFGTYEAASVAAYAALGHDAGAGLVAALLAHGIKTAYSLVAGGVALVAPAPSLLGRFRLARSAPVATPVPVPPGPVVVFYPAHDEETSVADVVHRTPRQVRGRPVEVVVIDDGSTDDTAARARVAGARVVSFEHNRGLGAAVRFGLHDAAERGAAAVVFLDADREYEPEELEQVVAPVLDGAADYVVGSRFAGAIEHMRPHRRFGNLVLTRALSFVARRQLTDGQSGYRALSASAAADAEVIHDFNYAQVLTLDLLAKGYRYQEVPITYRFRTTGRSFVKLNRYLREVVPAVYRELNPVSSRRLARA